MKITDVEALHLRLPHVEARTDSSQDAVLIRITTDAGLIGWGEVDSSPHMIAAIINAPYSHTMASGLRHLLLGEDPLETERLWHKMYAGTLYCGRSGAVLQAMAGIDIALWDIKGKALGKPVVDLLGGAMRHKMRVYSSNMFQFDIAETAARAAEAVEAGHSAIKFGWEPFGRDAAMDIAYVRAIRDAVGYDVDLMIDAGMAWDAKTAIQRARLLEEFDLLWIEEPLHPDNLTGYALVSAACTQYIAAGEEECAIPGFERLIDQGCIDIVQVDVTRTGFSQAIKIADYAHRRGRKICNHNFTTQINSAASLHFLCAIPNALIMEYCSEPGALTRDLVADRVRIEDGYAYLPEAPGLGVEPDLEVVAKFLV